LRTIHLTFSRVDPTMVKAAVFASCIAVANAQAAGSLTKEKHPPLDYSVCHSDGSCTKHTTGVVIDSNWRWTHKTGETTNCYTGNLWDKSICPDEATCSKNCVIEGADKEVRGNLWCEDQWQ